MLAFALCLAMSIMGGLVTVFIQYIQLYGETANPSSIVTKFGQTLHNQNLPLVLVEILNRIPINIVDRLIAALAGFGIALLGNKIRSIFYFTQRRGSL
jgi:hypothetical protein